MDTNSGLNKAQLEAVTAPLGPVLILAGAGSGKTRCLTMRIVYLIKKLGIKPHNILAVTFTNKAAGEMKERIVKLLQAPDKISNSPTMGTFHSIGVRILRAESRLVGLTPNFVIYDNDDQESLLKDILIALKLDPTKFKPALFAAVIDRAKNNLLEPGDLDEKDKKFTQTAREVYRRYQDGLLKNNAVDFGDLLMLPVQIFQKHPEILKKYQALWQYILVDEYQDTNHVQYLWTKMLAQAHKNIFVVGDDAQAIYGFRGANLQNILDFEDDYPDCKIIRLEQNYRSTSPILRIAEKIIELNSHQHKKRLWTDNETGGLPNLFSAEDETTEAYFVAGRILNIQDPPVTTKETELEYLTDDQSEDQGILSRLMKKSWGRVLPKLKNRQGLNQIAVLYRTHFQSRAFEEAFIASSIPYQIVGGLKFYERAEIKDILCYLRLLVNQNDLVSLKRVINKPARGIGEQSFKLLKDALLEKDEPLLSELFFKKPSVKGFFEMINFITGIEESANILDVLGQVIKLSGYEKFLRDGSEEGEGRWENVLELINVAGAFKRLPWKEAVSRFLEEVALMTSADEADLNTPKVTLMTLHQAKGLEFDTVFMVGLEEGLLPHSRSILDPKDIAEEVRLAYVGVTRARKMLFLVHAQSRRQYGSRNISVPSRILKAIPEELITRITNY
ncbi:MAG: hypothetical protein A3J07_02115 [Candidatus Doudnabacteria bacterium RIFCSPLOWO2_02_FULL_49_13]|uniref:DNA 3'-5' helicase n=1 Tax=Candidatus Doudnabacteria bacterium RIFCSPHIGHO2_12_FULL_48_16 TaxID=1817838 RepID=A0A1F5PLH2_9BACT|nr:MAG: hypothetical protein A3B77_00595 [Candidatus Doudnabacteria bacterium RIFCSPHIGHO2_02_FULL_49_24]OGE89671.1 MAG: hypothetical protein A2760_00705 [Candidatus Doudnabacteria bacterium RIFCSPHIGHO2_01_FULL_50_67]OGE90729.1 MAG: hypothetical protein A3E29_01215 [Candidatus Doudnabacteria bacterium RIFCSPHIGHO2_12_FULL_48_16]OGE96840.1 MAG: hypothetical protein A2990_03320 [Candidatus Doudnabacteria bacterium RIFCSPLOWO2_01_FULL_49_40]OGF02592.1 MAG: hypothetical protein A3J07_02115 [Candid